MKEYYKTTEVARMFDVSSMAIINWIRTGKISTYQTAGGNYRIKSEDLIKFAKERNRIIPEELKDEPRKYRILIVDDEKNAIESVKLVLDDIGFELEIETASDGFEAGIKAMSFKPDLVILDALMPGANGHRVVYLIKNTEELENIKILVLTGHPEEGEKMLKMGADKLIIKASKETDVNEFREKICSLLGVKYWKFISGAVN
ncbi:MAG: hypothetical protein A2328_09980 [Bdellovibrionales bacterium RIFOXYB2_FULL_36_6]|nr:MAG: hypothetical protein A2328_09980 [Bdellovibrionales bacterium RIFOXYB2_FULL_36_6]